MTRRELLASVTAAVGLAAARRDAVALDVQPARPVEPPARTFCFFSKHLAELGWSDLGKAVRDAGYGGVDLTVRTKGHVSPERAADDLPRAIDAISASGIAVPMITTELTSPAHPTARPILETAGRHGVRFFKTGYWHYRSPDVRAQIAQTGEALAGLTAIGRECGVRLGFHNHTAYVGAALWDIAPVMDRLDPQWAGYYFDPRHAVAEGGGGAWKAAVHLVRPRLIMMALKDFFWEKTDRTWRIRDCPLGEGAVDWAWMGSQAAEAGFAGPISIHFEYPVEGASPQEITRQMLRHAERDLAFARKVFG